MAGTSYELRNIAQRPTDNTGGVEALWYTRAANLLHFPARGPLAIAQTLQLAPGTFWYQLVSTRHTVRHKQTQKDLGRHGDVFQQRLQGTLSRNTPELAAGLEALDGQDLVALYRDRNGYVHLVGTPEQPLSWSDVFDSGADPGNRNNYDWTLSADTPRRMRPYLGTWQVSAQGLGGGITLGQGTGGDIRIVDARGNLMATVPAGRTVVLRSGFRVAYTII